MIDYQGQTPSFELGLETVTNVWVGLDAAFAGLRFSGGIDAANCAAKAQKIREDLVTERGALEGVIRN